MNWCDPEPKVSCLGEFFGKVQALRADWSVASHKELWFRGEPQLYESSFLKPALYRPPNSLTLNIGELIDIEYRQHTKFKRLSPTFMDGSIDYDFWDWDSYFLFQHHGGATRLLDWSDGALLALHFAVQDIPSNLGGGGGRDLDALVYVLNWEKLIEVIQSEFQTEDIPAKWRAYVSDLRQKEATDLEESSYEDAYLPTDQKEKDAFEIPMVPLVLDFPRFTRRIMAQRSGFIIFGRDPNFLVNELSRPGSSIKRIRIASENRKTLRQELSDAGITESVIFPDLDGLGRELRREWNDLNIR